MPRSLRLLFVPLVRLLNLSILTVTPSFVRMEFWRGTGFHCGSLETGMWRELSRSLFVAETCRNVTIYGVQTLFATIEWDPVTLLK